MSENILVSVPVWKSAVMRYVVLVFIIFGMGPSSVWAGWKSSRCNEFVGTYLITNFEENGDIDSRSLITFWEDGNFMFIDSNQGGVPTEFNPFTNATGSWTCSHARGKENVATIVALDFTLPGSEDPEQEIARLDFFDVTVDRKTGKINGSGKLHFLPFESNPLDRFETFEDPFFFEGIRVEARSMKNSRYFK